MPSKRVPLKPDLESFMAWKNRGATLEEVIREFHSQVWMVYISDRAQGLELVLKYLQFFCIKENYRSFPFGPHFIPTSGDVNVSWCTILQLLRFPWPLVQTVQPLFDSSPSSASARASAFRKGVATGTLRKAVAAALEAALEGGAAQTLPPVVPMASKYGITWVNVPPESV